MADGSSMTTAPAEAANAISEPASEVDAVPKSTEAIADSASGSATTPEPASSTPGTAASDADVPEKAVGTSAGGSDAGDGAEGTATSGTEAVTAAEPTAEFMPAEPLAATAASAVLVAIDDASVPAVAVATAAAPQEPENAAAAPGEAAAPEVDTEGEAPGQPQQQDQGPQHPPQAPHGVPDGESAAAKRLHALPPPQRHGLAAAGLRAVRGKWMRAKNAVATIFRAVKLVAADKLDFEKENKTALVQAQVGASDVALEVENVRDLAAINYAKQGNAEMYTEDALLARRAVRTHLAVVEAVRAWWRWLPKSSTRVVVLGQADEEADAAEAAEAGADTAAAAAAGGGGDDSGSWRASKADPDDVFAATLDCPIYSAMVVAITLVLLPRFGLPADPDYDPADDWVDDNKGLPYMDFPNFFDAMFELADMWSDNVDGPEYAQLLESLLRDVQALEASQGLFSALLKKFGHKPPEPKPEPAPAAPVPEPEPQPEPPAPASEPPAPDAPPPPPSKSAAKKPEPKAAPAPAPAPEPVKAAKPAEAKPKPAPPPVAPSPPPEAPAKPASPRARSPPRVPQRQQPPPSPPVRASPSPRTVAVAARQESSLELPDYEAADYSGVESTLGAYLRQKPPSPQRTRGPSEPQRRHVDIPMTEWDRPGFNPGLAYQQLSPRGTHYQHLTDGGAHLRGGAGGGHGHHPQGDGPGHAPWYGGGSGGDWFGAFGMQPGADALSGAMVRGFGIGRGGGGGRSGGATQQHYQPQPYQYPGVAYGGGGGGGRLEGSQSAYQLGGQTQQWGGGGGGSGSGMGQAQLGLGSGGGPHGGTPGSLYAEYMESVIAKRRRQSPQRAGGGGGGSGAPSPTHQQQHPYGYAVGRGRMSDPGGPAAGNAGPSRGGVAVVGSAALQGGASSSLLEVRPSTAGESDTRSRSPLPAGAGGGPGGGASSNGPRASGAGFLPRLPSGPLSAAGNGASPLSALTAAAAAHLPTINDQAGPSLALANGFNGYANSPAGPASPTRTAASGALSPTRRTSANPLGFWSYDASTGANGNGNGGINAAAVMLPNLSMDPRLAGFYSGTGAGGRSMEQQRRWRGSGGAGSGRGGVNGGGGAGSGGGSSQSNSPLPQQQPSFGPQAALGAQQARDLVKASRQQVNLMAQALVAQQAAEQQLKRQQQQAGLLQPRGGGPVVAAPAAPAGVIPAMLGSVHTSAGFGAGFGGSSSSSNSAGNNTGSSVTDGIKPPVNGHQKRMAAGGSFQSYVLAGKGAAR